MSAVYPGGFREWTTKYDYTTVVFSAHFNDAQDELTALLQVVGTTPQIARNDPGSTPFTLAKVVDWISNAPDEDRERVIEILRDSGPKKHGYDYERIIERMREYWPDWQGV